VEWDVKPLLTHSRKENCEIPRQRVPYLSSSAVRFFHEGPLYQLHDFYRFYITLLLQLDREMEESRRALQQPQAPSPPASKLCDVGEISHGVVDAAARIPGEHAHDTTSTGSPLDLSRRSPVESAITPPPALTDPQGVVGSTSGHGLTVGGPPLTETISQLPGSDVPAVTPTFTDVVNSPLVTQVTS